MANCRVTGVTRDSVTLTWVQAEGALAYSVARTGPLVEGEDPPPPLLLAAVYGTTYCDTDLLAGTRYGYEVEMLPEPERNPPPDPDSQRVSATTLPETVYADSRAFFTEALSRWYCRSTEGGGAVRWCPQWWLHEEAAERVDALWMAWEQCHTDQGTAPAAWWVNFADPNMRELFDQRSGFDGCSTERGHRPTHGPLPPTERTAIP